jgi:hypothetical protein
MVPRYKPLGEPAVEGTTFNHTGKLILHVTTGDLAFFLRLTGDLASRQTRTTADHESIDRFNCGLARFQF